MGRKTFPLIHVYLLGNSTVQFFGILGGFPDGNNSLSSRFPFSPLSLMSSQYPSLSCLSSSLVSFVGVRAQQGKHHAHGIGLLAFPIILLFSRNISLRVSFGDC